MNNKEKANICKSCGREINFLERVAIIDGGLICAQCERRLPTDSDIFKLSTCKSCGRTISSPQKAVIVESGLRLLYSQCEQCAAKTLHRCKVCFFIWAVSISLLLLLTVPLAVEAVEYEDEFIVALFIANLIATVFVWAAAITALLKQYAYSSVIAIISGVFSLPIGIVLIIAGVKMWRAKRYRYPLTTQFISDIQIDNNTFIKGLEKLKIGDTVDETLSLIGKPTKERKDKDGHERWIYEKTKKSRLLSTIYLNTVVITNNKVVEIILDSDWEEAKKHLSS